jgi:AcrR family transcriptional regulator
VQNMSETEDLRVRKTRKLLQKAMLELTVEKGYDAVTVRDLTERAMVNRSTFYRHYLDKHAVIDEYMDEVYGIFDAQKPDHKPGEPPPGLVMLLKHVQSLAEFYLVMLGQNGCASFTERFRENTMKRFREFMMTQSIELDPKSPPLELRLNYISCAAIGAIIWWLENKQPCTVEQLALWTSQLNVNIAGIMPVLPGGYVELAR